MKIIPTSSSIVTRNTHDMAAFTGNIYQSVAIIAKRANAIAEQMKEELKSKLDDFSSSIDNLEEIFENREQIEISKYYERLPKPSSIAAEEFMAGKLVFRNKNEEED
ncbi:MAG: DNA-directed RNA polymerase subunit omega [Cytophagales bacterium]|nr:MAG: DNA-directed RNA polymerase subunit omega [Cytophagales bacterium]